ncbi:DUF4245 domain-containing protein [Streptomyces sp. NPDC006879]|uniref:DUF4245 domain-containing protein n=1 Tax=Streptomyces sp. NPDC006879 TaxID=3364767 RepID=UPI003687BC34
MVGVAGMKGKQTIWDMVRSLAVIGVAVAAIYVFIPHDDDADPTRVIDYRVELITARRAAPYPVAAPAGLGEDWRATSVSYSRKDGNVWHLGFLTPDEQYVAVEQSSLPAQQFVPKVTQRAEAAEGGAVELDGRVWQPWDGPKYRALVLEEQGLVTVVTGTGSMEQLKAMAGSLEFSRAS